MGLTGRYDFKGIKKFGAAGLSAALASTPWGSVLVTRWGLKSVTDILLQWFVNWAANKGLVIMNIGAIAVEGEWDQKAFDGALEDAFRLVELAGSGMTPEQAKAIDDEVIKAARKFLVFTKHN